MNPELKHYNLIDFKEVMDKHGVKFVIIFGGLLGLVRGGELIEWDYDLDVMCYRPDKVKIGGVIEDLKKLDFTPILPPEVPEHDTNFVRNGYKIEIWWFDEVGDEWKYDDKIRYKKEFFDETEKIKFLDMDWDIPKNPKEFLTITYGESWVTPNKEGRYIL